MPLQVSNDLVTGVAGYTRFDCPKELVGGTQKLIVASYAAHADTRILNVADFWSVETVPVTFTFGAGPMMLF
ncbi:hypothetical protein H3V53_22165 [Paraburkholderia bengalensis]|uniref:Uncharacterized protein n=1 Tax=Paraburkholderia bengalensis TaxID=2747562 RepID=A0ABU8IW91_9BURK